jgi:hypothetical protein
VTSADEQVVSRVSGLLRPLGHLADPSAVALRPGHWLLCVAALAEAARSEALDAYAELRWEHSADDADVNPLASDLITDIRALMRAESGAGGGS